MSLLLDHDELLPLRTLPDGARVLDLGCGPGTLSYQAFPQLKFFGADQYAHTGTLGWPANASLALADAERLPWRDAAFAAAICGFSFEHFRDPRAVLRELYRVVRRGGLLHLSIPRHTSVEDRLYRFTFKGGGHLQRYTLESFTEMVYEETGFKLETFVVAPAGFTWLRDVPWGDFILRLLYRSFRAWQRATGRSPLASGSYLLLFRLGERHPAPRVRCVCAQCGDLIAEHPAAAGGRWRCPRCGFWNPVMN